MRCQLNDVQDDLIKENTEERVWGWLCVTCRLQNRYSVRAVNPCPFCSLGHYSRH